MAWLIGGCCARFVRVNSSLLIRNIGVSFSEESNMLRKMGNLSLSWGCKPEPPIFPAQ